MLPRYQVLLALLWPIVACNDKPKEAKNEESPQAQAPVPPTEWKPINGAELRVYELIDEGADPFDNGYEFPDAQIFPPCERTELERERISKRLDGPYSLRTFLRSTDRQQLSDCLEQIEHADDTKFLIGRALEIYPDDPIRWRSYLAQKNPALGPGDFREASMNTDGSIQVRISHLAAEAFTNVTERRRGHRIAFVLDEDVLTPPRVHDVMRTTSLQLVESWHHHDKKLDMTNVFSALTTPQR